MNSAVLSDPKWRYPVGEGANRVRAGVDGSAALLFCSFAVFDEMVRLDVREIRTRQERHVYEGNCGRKSNEKDMMGMRNKETPLWWFVQLSGAECSVPPPMSASGPLRLTAFARLHLPSKLRRLIVIIQKFACAVQLFWIDFAASAFRFVHTPVIPNFRIYSNLSR